MAKSRYDFQNRYVTTLAQDHTLTPWVDWILPLVAVPTDIENGKLFFVVFNVEDPLKRFVLRTYMDNGVVKYHGYSVSTLTEVLKYDTVAVNDVAEIFNLLFSITDDFGTIDENWGLDINVYGGNVVIGNDLVVINDTPLTLEDNKTNYVYIDYVDETIKVASVLPDTYYLLSTIVTAAGSIVTKTINKGFNIQDYFNADFFEDNAKREKVIKKQMSIDADQDWLKLKNDSETPGANKVYGTHPTTWEKWWFDNIGVDGKTPEFRVSWWYIQWRYVGDVAWINLMVAPVDGDDGREIELRKWTTYIQWRYSWDITRMNLISIADITWPAWSWASNVVWISQPQNNTIGDIAVFAHNLWMTQSDIESGRYQIKFTYKVTSTPAAGIDSAGVGALSWAPMVQQYIWDASDPVVPFNINMQADSLKVLSWSRWDNIENLRCIIIDNNIVWGWILPPWTTTYQTSFLVEDSLGNAITDAVITFNGVTNSAGYYTFDTILGNLSYTCSRPWYGTETGTVLIDGTTTHTIVLTTTWASMYNITFDINSDVLGSLTDAIVTLNGVTYPVGQMVFNMPDGTYNYTINRLWHSSVTDSVVLSGVNITETVSLTALSPLYHATFTVKDTIGTPITDAWIEFDWNIYPAAYYDFNTNADTYTYTVYRRWYTPVSGSITLSANTIIPIVMTSNAPLYPLEFIVQETP